MNPLARALVGTSLSLSLSLALALALASGARGGGGAAPEVLATGLQFAEGTIFVGPTLYLVDYAASDVLRLAGGKLERVWHGEGCGANGLLRVPEGLLVACFDADAIETITLEGKSLGRLDHDDTGERFSHPNDFASDGKGGFYFTASGAQASSGRVFHRLADGRVLGVASHLAFANGIGVSPDGRTLYVTESSAGRIDALAIAADGTLGPARVVATLAGVVPGSTPGALTPDSLRVDADGDLVVALYRGGGVAVVSPEGKLLRMIAVPGAHHTTLALTPDGQAIVVTAVDDVAGGYQGRLLKLPFMHR